MLKVAVLDQYKIKFTEMILLCPEFELYQTLTLSGISDSIGNFSSYSLYSKFLLTFLVLVTSPRVPCIGNFFSRSLYW